MTDPQPPPVVVSSTTELAEGESWNTRGTTEECAADFAGWHPDAPTLIHAIEVPMKWALMLGRTLPTWSSGRSVLLGDACHPTLPFLVQGAGCGRRVGSEPELLAQPDPLDRPTTAKR